MLNNIENVGFSNKFYFIRIKIHADVYVSIYTSKDNGFIQVRQRKQHTSRYQYCYSVC